MRAAQQQATQATQQNNTATTTAARVMGAYATAVGVARNALLGIPAAARSAGAAITQYVTAAAQRGAAALQRLGGAVAGVGRSAASAVGGLLTLGAVATAAFGVGAIKQAADFEAQLAVINTIAHVGREELYQLGESLQDSAVRSGLAIEDMTAAQYEFLSAGIGLFKEYNAQTGQITETFNVEQSAQAIDAASRLAVGGLASQTEAVTLLSFALNAYNLNANKISETTAKSAGLFVEAADGTRDFASSMGEASDIIADQFAKAIEIGVVTAQEIAGSFATVASSAKIAGIGIDEISASYAQQTVRGVSAARVTVSMNRAIQDLIQPSKTLRELQEELGKNYARIAETQGIHVAFQEMRTDANRLGIEYRDLFKRQEGWRFALNVTQDDLDDATGNFRLYQRVLAEVRQSEGAALEQMEERSDTVQRNFARLRLAFKILQEAVGRPLLQPVNEFLKTLTNVVIAMYDWARANQEVIKSVAPIIGVVSGLLALTAGTQGLLFVLVRVAPAIGATGTGLSSLARGLSIIAFPLAIVVGGVLALHEAINRGLGGMERFSGVARAMERIAAGLGEAFAEIGEAVAFMFDRVREGGNAFSSINTQMNNIGQAFEEVGEDVARVGQFIIGVFLGLGQAIAGALAAIGPIVVNWAGGVVNTIGRALVPLGLVLISWVLDAIPQVAGALLRFGQAVAANIVAVIPEVVRVTTGLARIMWNWILESIPQVIRALTEWAQTIARWLLDDALPAIGDAARRLVEGITEFFQDTQILRTLTRTAVTWVGAIVAGLAGLIAAIATWITTNMDRIVGLFEEVAREIVAGLVDFFSEAAPALAAAAIGLLGGIAEGIISNPGIIGDALIAIAGSAAFITAAVFIGQAFAAAMALGQAINTALKGAWGFVSGVVVDVVTAGVRHGLAYARASAAGQALAQAISGLWTALTSRVRAIVVAAAAHGVAYALSFSASALAWNWITGFTQPLMARIAPGIIAGGTITGTSLGAALAVAAGAAAAAGIAALPPLILTVLLRFIPEDFKPPSLKIPLNPAEIIQRTEQSTEGLAEQISRTSDQARAAVDGLRKQMILGGVTTEEFNAQLEVWAEQLAIASTKVNDLQTAVQYGQSELDVAKRTMATFPAVEGDPFLASLEALRAQALADLESWAIDPSQLIQDVPTTFAERLQQAEADVDASVKAMRRDLSTLNDDLKTQLEQIKDRQSQSQKSRVKDVRQTIKDIQAEIDKELKKPENKRDYTKIIDLQTLLQQATKDLAALQSAPEIYEGIIEEGKAQNEATEQLIKDLNARDRLTQIVRRQSAARPGRRDPSKPAGDGERPAKPGEGFATPKVEILPPSQVNSAVTPYRRLKERIVAEAEETRTGVNTAVRQIPDSIQAAGRTATAASTLSPYQRLKRRLADSAEQAGTAVKNEVNKIPPVVEAAGARAGEGAKRGLDSKQDVVRESARALARSASAGNWYEFGQHAAELWANGLKSMYYYVNQAAKELASGARGPLEFTIPKEGPLRGMGTWGQHAAQEWANNFASQVSYLKGKVSDYLGGASALMAPIMTPQVETAFAVSGPRQIAPITRGRFGDGYSGGADPVTAERQTELLSEIAGATRLGAAASARSASRDPRAGGPLAAKTTLQALKQVTITRTRG